jgi:choline dehydrogenase-like flavoprotein
MTNERTHFDAIVVGTGPGGATVARELARGSQRVLVLEWGGREPVTGKFGQAFRELFTPGKSLLFSYGPMGIVRGITVGGSSIYYCGTAFAPPFEMLERHGIDIRDEIAEAHAELPTAPLAPELLGPMTTRIMESARGLGLDWNPLPKFIYQDRCSSREPMGFYCAPSYDAKWNARMWVDEAVEHGAELRTGAKIHKVLVEKSTARGVSFMSGGRTREAYAEKIVVAAGGIGSPVILRASGIRRAGNDFFYDPLIWVMGEVDGPDEAPEMPMSAGVLCADDGYMMTDLCAPKALFAVMAAQAGRPRKIGAYGRTLQIMVKAKDGLGGHLTDRGGVRKRLAPEDEAKLLHGYERAKSILTRAGAKEIYRSGYVAAHPGGTVKVGDLLDENLQSEFENLYVCDCSVIPEPWGLPPTLTLIGFGKRLARHLLGAASRSEAAGDVRTAAALR